VEPEVLCAGGCGVSVTPPGPRWCHRCAAANAAKRGRWIKRAVLLVFCIIVAGVSYGVYAFIGNMASEELAGKQRIKADSATISKMCGPRALLIYQVTMRHSGNISITSADEEMTKILGNSACSH